MKQPKQPRTLSDLRKHPAIDEIRKERSSDYDHGYSYWCYLSEGWLNIYMESRTIHEPTVEEVCDIMKHTIHWDQMSSKWKDYYRSQYSDEFDSNGNPMWGIQ